ncbi:MAG: ferredoxin reductase [Myxococcales bacterium]|nr:ferredoxin reductase [Myxococcales bacterium]MCB9627842.1 ferredoxin reductase [Sandaracinaceae bacterium]
MFSKTTTASPLSKARDHVLRRLMLDRQVAFWTNELAPLHAQSGTGSCRARVGAIIQETPDTKTFVLQPGRALTYRAGQYVSVEVEVNGVRMHRCYSLSSAPGGDEVSITVKRVPDGRVSTWLHDHVDVGAILGLGAPSGDFVLPTDVTGPLLFVSGGSGITPLMSMARDLVQRGALRDVVWVHYARSAADVIFGRELAHLARTQPDFRLHLCLDDEPGAPRGFDEARFTALVPDYASRAAFQCGPGPMMDRVEQLFDAAGAAGHLKREAFVAAPAHTPSVSPGEPVQVTLLRSERAVIARGPGSLLEQLERAGERPAHGCRVGICHTCRCTKQSGTVENLLSGELSSAPDQEIQLCITRAHSDLKLDLA